MLTDNDKQCTGRPGHGLVLGRIGRCSGTPTSLPNPILRFGWREALPPSTDTTREPAPKTGSLAESQLAPSTSNGSATFLRDRRLGLASVSAATATASTVGSAAVVLSRFSYAWITAAEMRPRADTSWP
jgi:hypothetical protein